MERLAHFAPEEIVGTALLLAVLLFVALRPTAVMQRFDQPFATPAPGGGAARLIVPEARPIATPEPFLLFQRELARP